MARRELVPQLATVDHRSVENVAHELHPPLLAAAHQPVALARVFLGHERDNPVDVRERVPRAHQQQVGACLAVEIVHLVDRFEHRLPRDSVPDPIGLQQRIQRHPDLGAGQRFLDRAGRWARRQRRSIARELRQCGAEVRVAALAHRGRHIGVVLDARLWDLGGEPPEHHRDQLVLALSQRTSDCLDRSLNV